MDRRKFIQITALGAGGALLGGEAAWGASGPAILPRRYGSSDVVVVGAGAFGGWTAWHLNRKGAAVTLLDAYGAGNSRASSGGETRLMQVASPGRPVYVRMAQRAYALWSELEESSGERLMLSTGRLALYPEGADRRAVVAAITPLSELGVAGTEILDRAEIRHRWPQIHSDDIAFAAYDGGGVGGSTLMARRACQVVAREVERAGGEIRVARALPEFPAAGRLSELRLGDGETIRARHYVFACGPWLPKLFPELLARRLQVQRRDVLFHGVPPGDSRFSYPELPEWSVQGSGWYGFPDIDNRGLKAAPYPDLNSLDPDADERLVTPQQVKRAHDFVAHRFPAVAGQPVIESRVCQVTNTTDGDFLVDRHPDLENVWIVGGGSGHGFKHGPAVGEYAARRVLGEATDVKYDQTFRLRSEEPFDA